jgi:hypothetical protein
MMLHSKDFRRQTMQLKVGIELIRHFSVPITRPFGNLLKSFVKNTDPMKLKLSGMLLKFNQQFFIKVTDTAQNIEVIVKDYANQNIDNYLRGIAHKEKLCSNNLHSKFGYFKKRRYSLSQFS